MTKTEVAKLVLQLLGAFPNARITELTCEVYETALMDLDGELARKAVIALIKTERFFPTVAEIRSAVAELKRNRPIAEVLREQEELAISGEAAAAAEYARKNRKKPA